MNYLRYVLSTLAVLLFVGVNAAQAVIVDFDTEYTGVEGLADNFITADPTNPIQNTSGVSFVGGAVSFSGGIILRDPANPDMDPMAPAIFPGVFFGTAFSPTTSINVTDYLNPITINIDAAQGFTNVSGILLSGLNTNAPEYTGMDLASYEISFFNGDTLLGTDSTGGVEFTDTTSFGFDTFSIESAIFGAAITKVEIAANPFDLNSMDSIIQNEWDFLLDSISLEVGMNPVPVPAALPLFISALLGGFAFARPKRLRKL